MYGVRWVLVRGVTGYPGWGPGNAHLRGSNSPKIPRGPRGIGSRFPDPRGMKKCNPRFPESPRNENRQGIGIPTSDQKFKPITCHVWGPLGTGPGGHGGTRDGVPEMLFEPLEQTC
jgi:hypothetical protein